MISIKRSQPVINWSHPINVGLCVAWLPDFAFTNLATGHAFALSGSSNPLYNYNAAGYSVRFAHSSTSFLQNLTDGPSSKTEFTMLAMASAWSNTADTTQNIASLGNTTGGSGNYILIQIAGGAAIKSFWGLFFDSSYHSLSTSTAPNVDGGFADVFVVINSVSQARRENWLNGVLDGTGTAITTGGANNNCVTLFNNSNPSPAAPVESPVNFIIIWNRALSPQEIVTVSANPKVIFQPRQSRIPAGWVAGSAGAARRPVVFTAL